MDDRSVTTVRVPPPPSSVKGERMQSVGPDAAPGDFASFVARHHRRLVGAVAVHCDRGLAEEAVQEALVRTADRWDRVRLMEAPAGWTYRVARNLATSALRRRVLERRLRHRLDRGDAIHHDPDTPARLAVRGALRALPEGQREAVVLVDLLGFTTPAAADHLGRTPDAIRGLLERGRAALRRSLSDDHGPPPTTPHVRRDTEGA